MTALRIAAATALFSTAALLTACGGGQNRGSDDCLAFEEGLSSSRIEDRAACWVTRDPIEAAPVCRGAMVNAGSLTPDAAAAVTACVLAAGEREDGAWVAELIDAVAGEPDVVRAIAGEFGEHFDRDAHGTSFAVALTIAAQTALGELLADLDAADRIEIVRMGLAWTLDPLAGYSEPWLHELDPSDPAIDAWAASLDPDEAATTEDGRYALVAGGVWTGDEILRCAAGELGCDEGDDAFALLEHADAPMDDASGPRRGIQLIRSGELDAEAAEALARWIGSADYPRRDQMMESVLVDMTDIGMAEETRLAIARGAQGAMCTFATIRPFVYRSYFSDDAAATDDASPWPTYIARCTDTWTVEEAVQAMSAGSRLNVSESILDRVRQRIAAGIEGMTCDALVELADLGYAERGTFPTAGLAYAELDALAGSACAEAFDDRLEAVFADDDAHPEARLAVLERFTARGDTSRCGAIGEIMQWQDVEHREGPGPRAEAMAASVDGC